MNIIYIYYIVYKLIKFNRIPNKLFLTSISVNLSFVAINQNSNCVVWTFYVYYYYHHDAK